MKKILAILLAVALTFSLGVMAFAEDTTKTCDVSYTATESYIVEIPASQDVTTSEKTGTVSASGVLLINGNTLTVTMASKNGYNLVCGDSSIAYVMMLGDTQLSGASAQTVLSLESGETAKSATLKFYTTDAAVKLATVAGAHTDVLTFACTVSA